MIEQIRYISEPRDGSALSCVAPGDPRLVLTGTAQPPEWLADGEQWQEPRVVHGVVLSVHEARHPHAASAYVLVLGTSWGGAGVAVPGPLARIWSDPTWGPMLAAGQVVLEVELRKDRWTIPLCAAILQGEALDGMPAYDDRRSVAQMFGFGTSIDDERSALAERLIDACSEASLPFDAPRAEFAAALRARAAAVEQAQAPSRMYQPIGIAEQLRRWARETEDPAPLRPDLHRMSPARTIEQYENSLGVAASCTG